MGGAFGKRNQDQLLQKERIANEKIQTLERENEELRGLLLKEKAKNTKFQTFAICSSVYFILSLLSFWGIWFSWPVDVKVNVPLLENLIPNCSSDTRTLSCVLSSDSPTGSPPSTKSSTSDSDSPLLTTVVPSYAHQSTAPPTAPPPVLPSPIIAEPPALLSPIAAIPPSLLSPIVVKPIVSEPKVSEPTVIEPAAIEPAAIEPAAIEPTYIKELDSEEDPWHLICHLYWVVLFQNSEHHSYKNRSAVFKSAAARLLQNKKKDKMAEDLRFGLRDCAKLSSKCNSSKDAYVRVYHNGHYLDYEFPDDVAAAAATGGDSTDAKVRADACAGAKKAGAGTGSVDITAGGVFPADIHIADVGTNTSAGAGAHIDSLVAWIKALVELTTLYNRGSGARPMWFYERIPDGQNYCVNELSHFPIKKGGSWVVHCYNTSSPDHSNLSSLLVSAAHDLVHTQNLHFAQLNCTHEPPVPDLGGVYSGVVNRVTPYILFHDRSGSEYFPAEKRTHTDTRTDLVVWIRTCLRLRGAGRFMVDF